ncbi:MAG: DUF2019 domain-containing protein [Rhizobiales bacterium]|nr:DUF2019 domain-containing protein [Hyphomicrobiales bacterium]
MRHANLKRLTLPQLLGRFVEIALAQDEARLYLDVKKANMLYAKMEEIDDELRARGREARLALLTLYEHRNMQVRLKAAVNTLGVAPDRARFALEEIRASRTPQALDAGSSLRNLDRGVFKSIWLTLQLRNTEL